MQKQIKFFENPQNKIVLFGFFIVLVGLFLVALPPLIGLDGFDGGFAIQTISVMLIIPIGIIVMVMYRKRANALHSILTGESLIARWQYAKDEWLKYTEEEHKRDAADKGVMFIILVVTSVIVAFGYVVIAADKAAAVVVVAVLAALNMGIKLLVVVTVRARYSHNKNNLGEVYIGKRGVYLNKRFHGWGFFYSKLEDASINVATNCIDFTYSMLARGGRQYNTIQCAS